MAEDQSLEWIDVDRRRTERRETYDRWVASEIARHLHKDHPFTPGGEFDPDDAAGRMPVCERC